MSRLFETIRVVNRAFQHVEYHNARLNLSRKAIFGCTNALNVRDVAAIPSELGTGTYKCRVVYTTHIEQIEFLPYRQKAIRSLKLVECDSVEYGHKFINRARIDRLLDGIVTDDILIIKHGFITDTSFANIIFHDGKRWITPCTPLLSGTKRARLLDEHQITEEEIRKNDLKYFTGALLINAMLDIGCGHCIRIDDIR